MLRRRDHRIDYNYYLIVIGIFLSIFINSYVFFKQPVEFYLGYVIFLILLPVFIFRYGFQRDLLLIFFILLVSGLFNVFLGNNTVGQFVKIYTGLMMSYFFYYYVIVEFKFDLELLFKWYLKGAYIAALIGLCQFISYQIGFRPGYDFSWILNKWGYVPGGNFGIRVNSVFGEPTYLGAVLSAAFFVSVYNLIQPRPFGISRFQSIIIIVVYVLSFSGLGQVGIFLTLIFMAISFGVARYIVIIVPALLLLFNFMYTNVTEFRERYDSTVDLFFGSGKFELGKTHGSSFILYNNWIVASENFKSHFIFGTGLGSHPTAFERYSSAKHFKVYGFNLNSADANSMLLRLISETGLFGVGLVTLIIFKCYVRRNKDIDTSHWLISNSILIMILLNLFRQGHYFLNGFPFFVLLYYYNFYAYERHLESLGDQESPEGQDMLRVN